MRKYEAHEVVFTALALVCLLKRRCGFVITRIGTN